MYQDMQIYESCVFYLDMCDVPLRSATSLNKQYFLLFIFDFLKKIVLSLIAQLVLWNYSLIF